MQNRYWWLLVTTLTAWALRLTLLGYQSLWYDEGVTWLLTQTSPLNLIRWTAADIQPPLYYLLLWLTTHLFGSSEAALRFPSAIFGLLAVPLIYQTGQRLFGRASSAAWLAAGVVAASPLMVYYSQEARMYTLLVAEAILAGYLLLKLLNRPTRQPAPPTSFFSLDGTTVAYALTITAMLYTHYFALFLAAAHALYALRILWQRRFPPSSLWPLLQAGGITLLLFLPWASILLARLGDDPSYWPGGLKLDEALRQVWISFTLGETVLEQTGWRLSLGFLLLLILSLGFAVLPNPSSPARARGFILPPSSFFLLLWLILPITLILLLSYQSPKFNPRYTLIAWPACALLLAAGLAQFQGASRLARLPFFLALLFGLMTALFSLTNWFTDRRFAKDDFQALAQFVKERRASDETVLLSSGHMFPVWAYYYGGQGWTPLPKMERLDVNRVVSLEIAAEIEQAIQNKGGVWLVSWQDEVTDPNGIIPFWLDRVGTRPVDAGDFQGVRLEHWRLEPDKLPLLRQNPIQYPAGLPLQAGDSLTQAINSAYNFANQVDLVGLSPINDQELALFWRPRQPLPDNLVITMNLLDPDGLVWADQPSVGRPGAYLYPPSRWPVGQVVMTRQRLEWQQATPPGLYLAEIGLGQTDDTGQFNGWDILDEQGRPQRRTVMVGPVNLSQLVRGDPSNFTLAEPPLIDFSPIITLRSSHLSQNQAQAGDRLRLTQLWQAGQFSTDDISVAIELVDSAGRRFRVASSLTPSREFKLPLWRPFDLVKAQHWLAIPPEAATGVAQLEVRLTNVHTPAYDKRFPLTHLDILPTERNFTPPAAMDMTLEANFANLVTLLGADCSAGCQAKPGESITLTLYWRAEAALEINYTIFTHLLDPAETVLVNADHALPKPMPGWVPAEIITDSITLPLPSDIPPGDYPIEVGLYDPAHPNLLRLALTAGGERVILPQILKVEE
jgi:uncharacterized membrane protein